MTLKRTTVYTGPEEWLMANVVPAMQRWVEGNVPVLHSVLLGISGLGSGWFVALAFAGLGLVALAQRRRDLALLLARGTLAFPIEWALKYFTSTNPEISLGRSAQPCSTSMASGSTTSPTSRPATPCARRSCMGSPHSAWRASPTIGGRG